MKLHATPANPIPEGAVVGELVTSDDVRLRYACWRAAGSRRGTVCLALGRGDMIEKYYEVVAELLMRRFAVAVVDWRGQGGSQRMLADPRKGHVRSFDEYQLDLQSLMRDVVLPDCPPPYFALGHSMGGLILLDAVRQGRRWFDRIVLAAPMLEILRLRPRSAGSAAARLGVLLGLGNLYVPGGSRQAVVSAPFLDNALTSDPVRYQRSASIVEAVPELAIGAPTIAWANAAAKAMQAVTDPGYTAMMRQPMLLIGAGADTIVSTPAIARFAIRLRAGSHLVIPGCKHEILLERDLFRTQFWAAFDAFVPGSTAEPRVFAAETSA